MKNTKSFISILFFICAAAIVSAKPSNSRGVLYHVKTLPK